MSGVCPTQLPFNYIQNLLHLLGVIPLENYTVEAHPHPFWLDKFPHMMKLKTLEKRNYFLCTDSEEKKRLWLDALKQATVDPVGLLCILSVFEGGNYSHNVSLKTPALL